MKYLIDSDLVVDWLNGHQPTVNFLAPLFPQSIALSIITYSEIFEGIYGGRDPRQEQRVFLAFLRSVKVVAVTRGVAAATRACAARYAPRTVRWLIVHWTCLSPPRRWSMAWSS